SHGITETIVKLRDSKEPRLHYGLVEPRVSRRSHCDTARAHGAKGPWRHIRA
ncbi:unnamed protein product, partial [Coccothraustes coccothraustes]